MSSQSKGWILLTLGHDENKAKIKERDFPGKEGKTKEKETDLDRPATPSLFNGNPKTRNKISISQSRSTVALFENRSLLRHSKSFFILQGGAFHPNKKTFVCPRGRPGPLAEKARGPLPLFLPSYPYSFYLRSYHQSKTKKDVFLLGKERGNFAGLLVSPRKKVLSLQNNPFIPFTSFYKWEGRKFYNLKVKFSHFPQTILKFLNWLLLLAFSRPGAELIGRKAAKKYLKRIRSFCSNIMQQTKSALYIMQQYPYSEHRTITP
jgi:hypothetical protein